MRMSALQCVAIACRGLHVDTLDRLPTTALDKEKTSEGSGFYTPFWVLYIVLYMEESCNKRIKSWRTSLIMLFPSFTLKEQLAAPMTQAEELRCTTLQPGRHQHGAVVTKCKDEYPLYQPRSLCATAREDCPIRTAPEKDHVMSS